MMKKSLESEEETPIEWKDPLEAHKYVCDGAKIQCMFCASPGTLKATSTKIKLQDKPFATEGDKDGKVNFNFQGPCMHPSQQKPNAPPPPCKSIISLGKWMNVSKTFIGNNHALLAGSMITCSISGAPIRIIHSGQKASLGSLFKMDSPVMGMQPKEKAADEKASEASPMLLVTSVTGKVTALSSENVKYKVTGYNLSNVSENDRKRIKWVVEIDGKKENLQERGEILELKIKEDWIDKEIIVMPYLKTSTPKVSVKTKIEERLSLSFNGRFLTLRVVEKDKILRFSYKAVSGRPLDNGNFDYSKQRQKLPSIGPLPEGEYYINPQEIQYAKDRTVIDKVAGTVAPLVKKKVGTMPGGEYAWGIGRVWIYPQSVIVDGVLRDDFSIHGGVSPGSAGCIDLTSNDKVFFKVLEKYKEDCTKIRLKVNYNEI